MFPATVEFWPLAATTHDDESLATITKLDVQV